MSDDLRNKTRKAFAWDLLGTMLRQISSLSISIVLARLLAPEEFGVIGIAMVFVSFSNIFIDVGFTESLIQKKEVTDLDYSSVFYVNLLISLILCSAIFLGAPMVGRFFNMNAVTDVLAYLAIIPPIAALGRVHAAQLTRNLQFKELTKRDVIATILGGAAGIIAALYDQGVFSLVWQQVVSAVSGTILLWIGTRWRPGPRLSRRSVNTLLSFSIYVFLERLLATIFRKIDTLFIGKFFSAATLGYFSRAESLNAFVDNYTANTTGKIVFPALSRVQDDEVKFEAIFFRIINFMLVASTFMAGGLYFFSDLIIIGILGVKWSPSVIFFKILVFNVVIRSVRAVLLKSMLSKGLAKLMFKFGLIDKVLMLAVLPLGYYYGAIVFAWAIVGTRALMLLVNLIVVGNVMGFINFKKMILQISAPLISLIGLIIALLRLEYSSFFLGLLFLCTHYIILSKMKSLGLIILKEEIITIYGGIKVYMRNKKLGI